MIYIGRKAMARSSSSGNSESEENTGRVSASRKHLPENVSEGEVYKIASWGGVLVRRKCISCGEWGWFMGRRLICADCDPVDIPQGPGYYTNQQQSMHDNQYHGGGNEDTV